MSLLDPSLIDTAVAAIEKSINVALTMDPSAQKHLKRLQGCVLAVDISASDRVFFFGVKESPDAAKDNNEDPRYLICLLEAQENASVHIRASILSLVKLVGSRDKSLLFKTKEIELSGDSVRSQQILAFLSAINIDWEAFVANFIGDVPAHALGTSLRQSFFWGKSFTQSLIRDAEEFIKYELRLFPNKAIAAKQFANIDKLYQATENLEKRVRAHINKHSAES